MQLYQQDRMLGEVPLKMKGMRQTLTWVLLCLTIFVPLLFVPVFGRDQWLRSTGEVRYKLAIPSETTRPSTGPAAPRGGAPARPAGPRAPLPGSQRQPPAMTSGTPSSVSRPCLAGSRSAAGKWPPTVAGRAEKAAAAGAAPTAAAEAAAVLVPLGGALPSRVCLGCRTPARVVPRLKRHPKL